MMPYELGIIMDPIERINIKKDSSFAMLLEAQSRGWRIRYMLEKDRVVAESYSLKVEDSSQNWFELSDFRTIDLADMDVVLMRKDPPFNMEYIYATYLLELVEKTGTVVVNRPDSLRDCNEKLFTAWFPECCAPTLVTRRAEQVRQQ